MFKVAVANITPDTATGIGAWTEEMFVNKFRNNSSHEVVNRYREEKIPLCHGTLMVK